MELLYNPGKQVSGKRDRYLITDDTTTTTATTTTAITTTTTIDILLQSQM